MNESSTSRRAAVNMAIAAVVAFAIGFGAGSLWERRSAPGEEMATLPSGGGLAGSNLAAGITPLSPASVKNSVEVADQTPGSKVKVSKVVLERVGWVAIHEDVNGTPGKILGARKFLAGTGSGEVELLRNTQEEKVYYAMLHDENGDGTFDHRADLPLKDANGNPIMMRFLTSTRTSVQ